MANKIVNHPFDPFNHADFDVISTEIEGKTKMKEIEEVIEKKRKDIFDILSTGRANGNDDVDEKSLEKMQRALNEKKKDLEEHLGEVTTNLNLLKDDNSDLVKYCKSILDAEDPAKVDMTLAGECGDLLSTLQEVYTKGSRKEKLFSGKKDDASDDFADLIEPDVFSDIINAGDEATLQSKIDEFVKKTFSPRDNSFGITKSKLYTSPVEQAKVAARIAIFLHCMQKALKEGRVDKTKATKIKSILKKLRDEQIPKIRGIYNLKKEKMAVDAEYDTLVDIRKNDIADIDWTDTTTNIDLTDSFESKSTGMAKDIDFYNLNKDTIKITIGATTYPASDIVLKDSSGETSELNKMIGASGDYTLCIKIAGSEIKLGELCINYSDPKKALFILKGDPDIDTNLSTKGVTGDVNLEIPIMAVKNVKKERSHTGQVSLTRLVKAKLKGSSTPPVTLDAQREWQTTISNVDQVNRAIAEREADEELRERYRNVGWNIFDRANLFLRRKFIKDKIVREKMKGKEGFDWTDSGQSAAHRHQIEEKENLSDNLKVVVDVDEVNYPQTRAELDTLIDDYTGRNSIPPRQGGIGENKFQKRFNYILERSGKPGEGLDETAPAGASSDWKPLSEIIKSNDLKSLSTNLMMQAKQFQAHQFMVSSILNHIAANPTESDTAFDAWCRTEIENYINTYDDIPDFLHQMKLSLDKIDDIKTLKKNDAALVAIQAQSLKYRLQILDGGDEAYNVKKDKGGLLTRAGRRLDDPTENTKLGKRLEKHPAAKETFGWIRGGAKLAAIPTALFFSSMGPLATAGVIGGVSGLTTLVKKKSHYEKEHRSYQRMQATNLMDYRAKRTNLANEVAGMKWYEGRFWGKKKRTRDQYRDYVLATQDQLELTSDLIAKIKVELRKGKVLTAGERDSLGDLLADGLARLDFHKETGQNFLGSNNPKQAEFEYKQLQNALIGGSLRLGIDVSDLRTKSPYDAYYNNVKKIIMEGTGDKYDTQGYQKARKRFKRRSNLKAIDSALLTGGVSFGLSYLASSLASRNTVETNDVYTSKSSGTYGGQYNPGHVDESLLIPGSSPTGSINPEMYAHINGSTSEITGCQLYSSVDSLRCTAGHGARELARASGNISASLSNPVVAGNPDLVTAVNNYMTDVTRQVGMIPGLDAGNHDLVIARAYEALNSGVLDPIITSGNTSLVVNPTGFTWINGGVQASSTGTVGQAFRNMGIVGLDYVEKGTEEVVKHVTRAIAIPAGLNTFGSPKSDPK